MAKKTTPTLLEQSVCENEAGGWDFVCPVNDGTCGSREHRTPFASRGWGTQELALTRGAEHFAEHKSTLTGEPAAMPELVEFMVANGLATDPSTVVTAKDL